MKLKNIACIASILVASLTGANAANTLTSWTFDNLAIGPNSSPAPATNFGTASAIGLGVTSNPDVQGLAGSSTGTAGTNCWRVRGTAGIGWNTNAAIGTQGAKFAGSTFGYYQVKASFDVYATANAEANLLVQYTTEGNFWHNATITSVGTVGVIATNTATNSTILGQYLQLGAGWNNQIVVDLTGIPGVDNNAKFAIRLVNASTGTNCVTTTGAIYNNTSGDWTFDNVLIAGVAIDTIADWTFESYGTTGYVPNPAPELNFSTATFAQALGFSNNYSYSGTANLGSTNAPDTLVQAGSSTPSGTICWRVRGQGNTSGSGNNNGWNSAAPIGAQGAEFDASTLNYSNVVVTFDLYFTQQSEVKSCVLYTTDGWVTTNVANNLSYAANPLFIATNDPADTLNYSPLTVSGVYFYQNIGAGWYNNLVVDFTGVPGVDNNPNFGIRIVNAATGADCVAYNGGPYNNSSGNNRYDNVTVGGKFTGSTPPTLNYDSNATVDHPFTNNLSSDDATWRASITSIYVNGSLLTNSAYATNTAGLIVFNPVNSSVLQSSGVKTIVITATGYSTVKVTQPLNAGVATQLAITTQPVAPSASGGTLVANPTLLIADQFSNGTTNPYANVTVVASVGGTGAWTLGGDTNQASVNGLIAFTNLTATVNGTTNVPGAFIKYTITGYGPLALTNSSTFIIGKPAANFSKGNLALIQLDQQGIPNNTTFSIIELKPSTANQTAPANIIPVSATGTNALRLCSAGSCGKLSLSDDGTLICFAAFADGNASTPDETFYLNRAVAGLNYTNKLVMGLSYMSTSLGGSQARSAATLDNVNWIVNDKGGLYYGSAATSTPDSLNSYNNVVVRTFGGVPYVETQKTQNGQVIPAVYALGFDNDTSLWDVTKANNLTTDPVAADFYMISTNVLYILDNNSSSFGVIKKYSWVAGADLNNPNGNYGWADNGSFTNGTGGDSLFATTNGNGNVYLYYTTTAVDKKAGNYVIRLTDASGYNTAMSITSSNLIYTAPTNTYVKGLTFVPQQTAYATELTPPPILTAQNVAPVSSPFSITNTPDDPAWRAAITSITVNGTTLSSSAYTNTVAGKIVFVPAQSTLLQSPGSKTIVISATGYSTNSIVQALTIGTASKLVITTQPSSPAADGGTLVTQPVVKVADTFGNVVTNSTASITNAAGQATWTLGGTKTQTAVLGVATFVGLSAFSTNAVTGATLHFTSGSLTAADSTAFNIPAPILSNLGGVALTSGGKIAFTFTNAPGLTFSVVGTNDLSVPKTSWPVVGQAVEGPAGTYEYTNSAATNAQQYYIIRQP